MPRLIGPLLALALVTAGCVTSSPEADHEVQVVDNGRDGEQRSDDEAWVVWLHGAERNDAPPQTGLCDNAMSHEIDPQNRSLTLYDSVDEDDLWGVLVLDHFDQNPHCPIAYNAHPNPDPDEPTRVDLDAGGELEVTVHRDGRLTVDGGTVEQGEAARVTYEGRETIEGEQYQVRGRLLVETLGAWSLDRIEHR